MIYLIGLPFVIIPRGPDLALIIDESGHSADIHVGGLGGGKGVIEGSDVGHDGAIIGARGHEVIDVQQGLYSFPSIDRSQALR